MKAEKLVHTPAVTPRNRGSQNGVPARLFELMLCCGKRFTDQVVVEHSRHLPQSLFAQYIAFDPIFFAEWREPCALPAALARAVVSVSAPLPAGMAHFSGAQTVGLLCFGIGARL